MESLIKISALLTGISGQVAQIILIREFLIVFSGNEFYVGLVLSNWLLLEATGAFFSMRILRRRLSIEGFIFAILIFCVALSFSILLVRILKPTLNVSIAEMMGLESAFLSSLFILSFVSGVHGALFVYTAAIYKAFSGKEREAAGIVYSYETVGTVAGGIVATYIFVSFFDSFRVVAIISFFNCLLCLFISLRTRKLTHPVFYLSLLFTAISLLMIFQSNSIHWYSIKKQYPNLNVVHYENSKYGNITVVENEGQYIFLQNGIPEIFIPFPDMIAIEEFVHIPLLSHENPKEILIVGVGAGGVINEILKHPKVEKIDYVELDPLCLELLRKFKTPLTEKELSSPKLNVIYADGRYFMNMTEKRYDIILIGIETPSTLETNRLFTEEFFEIAKNRLKTNAIFVTGLLHSTSRQAQELRELTGTVYQTLKRVFSFVRPLPGEGRIIFLCSDSDTVLKVNERVLIQRIEERKLASGSNLPWYIEKKFHPGWKKWFEAFSEEKRLRTNSDLHPVAVFQTLIYFQSIFSPYCSKILKSLKFLGIEILYGLVGGIFLFYLFFRVSAKKTESSFILVSLFTTGFYGMLIELIIVFTFQSLLGYVFSWVGLLFSAYMAGAALGAYLFSKEGRRRDFNLRLFAFTEFALVFFSLLFATVLLFLKAETSAFALKGTFLFLSFLAGFTVGMQFPLGNLIYIGFGAHPAKAYSLISGSDLAGGFLAGLLGGFWLVPALGVMENCYLLAVIKLASGTVFVIEFLKKGEKGHA